MSKESLEELRERLIRDERVRQMIRVRAYEIYKMRGHHPGSQAQDWFQAEEEIVAFLMAGEASAAEEKQSRQPAPPQSTTSQEGKASAKKPRSPRASAPKKAGSKAPGPKRTSSKKATEPKSKRTARQPKQEDPH